MTHTDRENKRLVKLDVKLMVGIPPIMGRGDALGNGGNPSPPPNTITHHLLFQTILLSISKTIV